MRISITKILNYLDCPRKYWYSYELFIKTPMGEGFYFGSAIHSGLESYYSGKDPIEGVRNALFGKKENPGQEAKEGIDLQKLFEESKRIFSVYLKQAPYFKPVLIEHRFSVPLVHPESQERLPAVFTGKIDLITAEGAVVDHKTASGSPNGFYDDKNNFQANGYAYAYWQMFGKLPSSFVFNYIIKGNSRREPRMEHKIIKPQMGDICAFFDQCKYVLDALIRKETRDYPNSSKWTCRFCSYKDICSYTK